MVYERDCCMSCVVYRLLRNLERFSGSFFPNGEILFLFFTEELERLSGAGLWVAWTWPEGEFVVLGDSLLGVSLLGRPSRLGWSSRSRALPPWFGVGRD